MSTRIGWRDGIVMGLSCGLSQWGVVCRLQRQDHVQNGAPQRPWALGTDFAAERTNRVRAPMQTDAGVGGAGFGRKAFLENPAQIPITDAASVIRKRHVQSLPTRIIEDTRPNSQRAVFAARVSNRFGGVQDEILKHLLQRRTRHSNAPELPQGGI